MKFGSAKIRLLTEICKNHLENERTSENYEVVAADLVPKKKKRQFPTSAARKLSPAKNSSLTVTI